MEDSEATKPEADNAHEELTEKALEKRKIGEWRKTAKQLKAKDTQNRLLAIAKCDQDHEFLSKGDCLVPLLQLCAPSKKNKNDIVEAATKALRSFLEETASGNTESHEHALMVLELIDKTSSKLPGSRLFTDIFMHDNIDIAANALDAYACLVRAVASRDREQSSTQKEALVTQKHDAISSVAAVLDRYLLPNMNEAHLPENEGDDNDAIEAKKAHILSAALFVLRFLLETKQTMSGANYMSLTTSSEACSALSQAPGGVSALLTCATANSTFAEISTSALELLEAATCNENSGIAVSLLSNQTVVQTFVDKVLVLCDITVDEEAKPPTRDLIHSLRVLEKMLVAVCSPHEVPTNEPVPAQAPTTSAQVVHMEANPLTPPAAVGVAADSNVDGERATTKSQSSVAATHPVPRIDQLAVDLLFEKATVALSSAINYCLSRVESSDVAVVPEIYETIVVTTICLDRFIQTFGRKGYVVMTRSDSTAVPKKLLKLLICPCTDHRVRFSIEKALHHLSRYDEEECLILVTEEDGTMLDAAFLVASLSVGTDEDARYRSIRFAEKLMASDENAVALGKENACDPLLTCISEWKARIQSNPAEFDVFGVDIDVGAAISCQALLRLAQVSVESQTYLTSEDAIAILDGALAKGPLSPLYKRDVTLREDDQIAPLYESLAKISDPSMVSWAQISASSRTNSDAVPATASVRALVADLMATLLTHESKQGEDQRTLVTANTAETTLAMALLQKDDGEASTSAGLPFDLDSSIMNLLMAIAMSKDGRDALLAAATLDTVNDTDEDRMDLFESPKDSPDASWKPYACVLDFPLRLLADRTATFARQSTAINVLAALTIDNTYPASLQPIDVDRFAAQTIALGGLVLLCELASQRTLSIRAAAVHRPQLSDEIDLLTASARCLALDLIERAAQREMRLDARAAAAGAEAYEQYVVQEFEKLDQRERDAAEEASKAEKKKAAANKKKGAAAATRPPVETAVCDDAELKRQRALNEAEVRTQATSICADAAAAAAADERGGPNRSQWSQMLSGQQHVSKTALVSALSGGEKWCSCLVSALLEAGADVEGRDENGATPLACALARGCLDDVARLLSYDADVDAVDATGVPVLQYAFVAPEVPKLDEAIEDALGQSIMSSRLVANSLSVVASLIDVGADVNAAETHTGKYPLHWAIEGVSKSVVFDGTFECVLTFEASSETASLLLERGADINRCDVSGATPLYAAVYLGRADLASLLLAAGAQPNLANSGDRLPLHIACGRLGEPGFHRVAEELLSRGVTRPRAIAVYDNSRAGRTRTEKRKLTVAAVLDVAFEAATHPAVVIDRLPSTTELLGALDSAGRTPIHYAAGAGADDRQRSSDEVLQRRAKAVADLISRNDVDIKAVVVPCAAEYDATVVHLAIRRFKDFAVYVLDALVTKSAAPLVDELVSCPPDSSSVTELSFDGAAPAPAPTLELFSPLHFAIVADAPRVVRWLLEHGASPAPRPHAKTPLMLAALYGASFSTTRLLVEASPPGDAVVPHADLGGCSMAHVAAERGNCSSLAAILPEDTTPDVLDCLCRTPLHVATCAKQVQAIKLLLDAGADASISDSGGITPLDIAIDLASTQILDLLLAARQTVASANHLFRAERRHIDAACALYSLPPNKRTGSEAALSLDLATQVLIRLQSACKADIQYDQHIDPCFAQGKLYSAILEESEKAEQTRRDQEAAALGIQVAVRRRKEQKERRKSAMLAKKKQNHKKKCRKRKN